MVVASGEDAQVVGGGDSSGIRWLAVPESESIFCDSGLVDIISTFCANQETFVADSHVEYCGGTLEDIGEETRVDVRLLVVQI